MRRSSGSWPPSPTLTLRLSLSWPIRQLSQKFSNIAQAALASVTGIGVIASPRRFLAPPARPCNHGSNRYRSGGSRRSGRRRGAIPLRVGAESSQFLFLCQRCRNGCPQEKNLAVEAEHAPQPPRADADQISGMPQLRRIEAAAQHVRGLRPL